MFWSLAVFLPVVANTMLDQILFKEYTPLLALARREEVMLAR